MLQNPLDEADTSTMPAQPPWPRSTTILLLLTGLVLAVMTFVTVLLMPSLPWHGARDLELNATYQAYRETGVLLIKPTGPAPGTRKRPRTAPTRRPPGTTTPARTSSPAPLARDGLAVAVRRPQGSHGGSGGAPSPGAATRRRPAVPARRAGYVLLAMPALLWLVNHGTVLLGTEYGLSNAAALRASTPSTASRHRSSFSP